MKKLKTFILFILLVVIWSLVFWLYKYYFWWLYREVDKTINLQTISGYIALGLFIAYLSGWIITKVFSKRALLIFVWIINLACLIFLYFFSLDNLILFNVITFLFWFFYGIWAVLKIIISWIEIEKTGMSDTAVNAVVTIAYIVMLIAWSILGSYMSETIGTYGIWIISILIITTSIIWYFMIYDEDILIESKVGKFKKELTLFLRQRCYYYILLYEL